VVSSRYPQLRWQVLAATAWLLSGCGGGGGDDSSSSAAAITPPRAVEQTDLQIASAIYGGGPRTPNGFYAESAPSGHANVATTHLKNTDIDPDLPGSAPQFELCTNNWDEALNWSEVSAHRSSQYANLVATNDDTRYFEFGRMRSGTPDIYVQARVYKCAHLNRTAANLRAASGAAGQLNARPLTADELQRTSEYLWQFTMYNNFGNVVLKSSRSIGTPLEHTLHIAQLVRSGMSVSCDRIDVIAWRHRADSTSGALTLEVQTLWSFGARETAGVAQLCAQ
jgi:hypothetical protein